MMINTIELNIKGIGFLLEKNETVGYLGWVDLSIQTRESPTFSAVGPVDVFLQQILLYLKRILILAS